MNQDITMSAKELSTYEVITKLIQQQVNGTEASKLIGRSLRQVRRMKAAVKQRGARGLIHKNRGRVSNRSIPQNAINEIHSIVQKTYHDFGPTFAAEKLQENHGITVGREKLRNLMTDWGFWRPKQRKGNKEYRSWRERKEYEGEMIQFDGSYHRWFEDRAGECCLLAAIDDATGKIMKARFGFNESVHSVFEFWKEYVEQVGKPISIYLDKYSTYKINHKAAEDNSELLTQFQRAACSLDIKLITAHSPQAKGRVERVFETLQDRLVKELRLRNISTIEEANIFLEKVFLPEFNKKFTVIAAKRGDLHRFLNDREKRDVDHICSVHSKRNVNNDFTIRFKNQWIQLEKIQPCTVLRSDTVLMEERLDGTTRIRLRNQYLNFRLLPQRPAKMKVNLPALTYGKSPWKPPANHPWRRFVFTENVSQRYQRSPLVSNASPGTTEGVVFRNTPR